MAQLFKRRSNAIFRFALLLIAGGPAALGAVGVAYKWSAYETEVGVPLEQPVPFSHQHHVGGLGIDCRYCHTSVEVSATAGMPSSHTCMTCHSQIWQEAPMLQPVRDSFRNGEPLRWQRVHRLPQYVYFNHSIHVTKGIGCASCHGRVDQMPILWKARPFYMKDCLACHREPERSIRPKDEVFNLDWTGPADPRERLELGRRLVDEYRIPKGRLEDCATCHR